MKYLLVCLIFPIILILFVVAFGFGALYFGVDNLLELMRELMRKNSTG
jgi:hypothetical protein